MTIGTSLPPVCVLVGGRGTRLGALTDDLPKPLLQVAGRPFLEWILLRLRDAGFREAVLCTGYREDRFPTALADYAHLGVRLSYSSDGPRPLGTLGAVRNALAHLGDPVPITYGDTLLTAPFCEVVQQHEHRNAVATMTVLRNGNAGDVSNAVVENGRVSKYSKNPTPPDAKWIDYGFLVLSRSSIASSSEDDLAPHLEDLAERGRVDAFPVSEPFHEIGTPESLLATDHWIRANTGVQ